jgi:hypothetical protein
MHLQTHPGSCSVLASLGRAALVVVAGLLLAPCLGSGAAAQTTSTLAAETGNNTSASSFPQHDNGNVVAGNVSKLDSHTLLYPGATTSVYAHFQPWFCMPGSGSPVQRCNGHILTGYNSNDATTVSNQVTDMISRGIQGVIIDWYGSRAAIENGTALKMMAEGQSRSPVFQFAIMEDKGAAQNCMNATGQSETQCVISDLNYVASTYYPSPAYMQKGGRPVVFFFIDASDPVDWNQVRSGVSGNPLFVFEDNFSRTQANGAFSWVKPGIDNVGYLDGFYGNARAASGEHAFGSSSKGFNDKYATWGSNRFLDQQCGTTWLQLAAQVSASGYSSSSQLESFGLVTWNDYDEGTEIESGIDNCLSVSASISGNTLSWSLAGSGQESTIDRYRVWSTPASDGQNLTLQREITAGGAHSLDLTTLALTSGTTYTIYVQAVGKPTILNHMANGVGYTAGSGGPTRSVTITSPADGSASTSPVHVVASESTGTSTDMQIYLDGTLVFDQPNVHAIDTEVSAAVGPHAIAVKAWYADGSDVLSTVDVTVSSGGTRGVTVTSPAAGASVASPVTVSGFEDSGTATDMQIYLDGGLVYDRPNVQSISAQIAMGAGSHRITVKAWYSDGSDLYTAVDFTVTSGSARGVTVTSPVSGGSSASPVHVVGYEDSGTAVDMQIYLDGGLVYDRANVQSLDAHIAMAAGSHSITVKSWYADGTSQLSTVSVTATSGSPRGVTITGPLDGTSVSSPVHVVAYEDSGSATDMQIYVDGSLVFDQQNIESIDARLGMASGTRYVVVKSWYADGTNLSSAVSITVN